MKIGIIGSGIAGLSAAWLLGKLGHDVILFEKQPKVGIDSFRYDHSTAGALIPFDIPSRLTNAGLWPELIELYLAAGIETVDVDSSQSFSQRDIQRGSQTYLELDLLSMFAVRPFSMTNRIARRIVADIVRFQVEGNRDFEQGIGCDTTFENYLNENRYSKEFIWHFLYPILSSTVCTCSYHAISRYPAPVLLEALSKLTGRPKKSGSFLLRTKSGMTDVANRLSRNSVEINTKTQVTSIVDRGDCVLVDSKRAGSNSLDRRKFDHVVVATQANHAIKLLQEPTDIEREMLGCFDYEQVTVVVHGDKDLMPTEKKSWATFNMVVESPEIQSSAMCSIWLNRFRDGSSFDGLQENLFQTINPLFEPASDKLFCRRTLQRPVVNQNSFAGWKLIENIHLQKDRRIWFSGSYASPGVPLLENGVVSSRRVVDALESQQIHFAGN